jgi:hypothetical protein
LKKTERAQGLVELAIALPVLLLLLLGVLDIGRAYWTLVSLKDAVAEGAQYAATYPDRASEIKLRASQSSTALVVLTEDMFTVDYVDPPTPGEPITVAVTYDFWVVNPVVNAMVPDGKLTLSASDVRVILSR